MNTTRRAAAAALALGVVTVLVGCTSADSGEWSRPELDTIPSFTAADVLPFDAYHRSDSDLAALQLAVVERLSDCAREYGVDVTYGGDYLRPSDNSRTMWGGRLGTLDAAHASQYGYHASPDGAWAPVGGFYLKDPSNIQPAPDENAEQGLIVTYGPSSEESTTVPRDSAGVPVPLGGCLAQVEEATGGALVSDNEVTAELINLSLVDDRVARATTEWSACMSASGYDYDLVQGPAESFSLALITQQEIEVALADVKCTDESRWADVFYAILHDYQAQAIQRHPDDFGAVLASQTARLSALNISDGQ